MVPCPLQWQPVQILDNHVLKMILCKLTSATYLTKGNLGIKLSRPYLRSALANSNANVQHIQSVSQSGMSRYFVKKEIQSLKSRLPGSGRKLFAEKYPDLTKLMLALFDSAGEGLSSHCRLISDLLFLDKTCWLDMPRCVSILNQVFGIPISVSAAYNYTDNAKSNTAEAKRHNGGRNINPGILLSRSTRDGQKKRSVNSHYATADLNYAFSEAFSTGAQQIVETSCLRRPRLGEGFAKNFICYNIPVGEYQRHQV